MWNKTVYWGGVPVEFKGCILFPIVELGISQIYLNQGKLSAVRSWFDPKQLHTYQPLPVHDFGNGRYTLTDGHSRAFVAYQMGLTHVPILYDMDDLVAGHTGRLLYSADIEWCNRFGLKDIRCLQDRIVDRETYERLWIERCDRSFQLLTATSEGEREAIRDKAPALFLYGANEGLTVFYFEDIAGNLFCMENGVIVRESGQ